MANKAHWKKGISAAALSALIWSGTAWPAPHAMAADKPFKDVPSGHWAEKHIVKLALQGVIKGQGVGIFAPSKELSRQDAVILALKLMGVTEDDIDVGGAITLPGALKISNYAIPYINEAIKRRILLADEETALANLEAGKSWGPASASREWVAKLLVRAIGKDAEAKANAGKATSFSDDASIDAKLRPYVLTAVQNGLVSGIETNIGGVKKIKFDPKTSINRAAMATLISKAQAKVSVAYAGQVSGVLLSTGADQLSVLYDNGEIKTHALTAGSLITRFDSNVPTPWGTLKQYGKATLILDDDGSVAYVEQTDDKAYVKSVDGTFSSLNTETGHIWLSVGKDFEKISYDKSFPPVVTDLQGNRVQLSEIPEGAVLSLKVDTVRAEGKVVSVSIKQTVVNKTGSGVVTAWNPASGQLQITDPATGKDETWTVPASAIFEQDNIPVGKDTLQVGTTVTYTVKAGVVTNVEFAKPAITSVTGKFLNVDKTNKLINYFVQEEPGAKQYTVVPAVKIEGMPDATLDDLQKDDNVKLTLDAGGRVTQIEVIGRSVITLHGATLVEYVEDLKGLALRDSAGNRKFLYLVPNTRYDLNGTSLTEEVALRMINVPGKKLQISYSGENVVYVSIIAKYTGTVLENNTTSRTLKLQLSPSGTVTLNYTYPAVEIYGQSSASYTDVKAGDTVTVLLNSNQDQAASIQLQKNAQLEVVSADTAAMKLRTRIPGSSTIEEWSISSSVVLQDDNGAAAALGQFTAGSLVNATFMGKTNPTKFKLVNVSYGRVVSVNTGSSTMEVQLTSGQTVTKSVGASPVILKDNTTLTSLSAVQPNDRVEIRKDERDRTVIQIVPAVLKAFASYDSRTNSIQVLKATLTENNVYNLEANTYIHQGATVLTAAQLGYGDPISLYILRGKVVEISK